MRTTILAFTILIFSITTLAQNSNYKKIMAVTKVAFDSAKTLEDYMSTSNQFERIALAENSEWLPYYYASLSLINANFVTTKNNQKDQLIDKAEKLFNKAIQLAPNESELYILQALIYSGRLSIDPMGRGMEYAPKLQMAYAKAAELNHENPRVYFLQGNQTFHTPVNFGGGAKKSLPLLEKAKSKFDSFKPQSQLHPNWGKEENLELLKKCKDI